MVLNFADGDAVIVAIAAPEFVGDLVLRTAEGVIRCVPSIENSGVWVTAKTDALGDTDATDERFDVPVSLVDADERIEGEGEAPDV